MRLEYLFFILLWVINVYCSLYNTGPEEIAALVSSSKDKNGKIMTEDDGTYYIYELTKNDKNSNHQVEYGNIIDISPKLRNIRNIYTKLIDNENNLERKNELRKEMTKLIDMNFQRLTNLASDVRINNFENSGNKINPFDDYDVINQLTDGKISLFNNNNGIKPQNIYYPADNIINKKFKEKLQNKEININDIFEKNDNDYINIGKLTNKNIKEQIKTNIDEIYKASTEKYNEYKKVFEEVAKYCSKTIKCYDIFKKDYNNSKKLDFLNFYIVESENEEKEKFYSFMVNDNTIDNKSSVHIVTFKKDENGKFTDMEDIISYKDIPFKEINEKFKVEDDESTIYNSYNKKYYLPNSLFYSPEDDKENTNTVGIKSKGIGLLPEFGVGVVKKYIRENNESYYVTYGSKEYKIDDNTVNTSMLSTWNANINDIEKRYSKANDDLNDLLGTKSNLYKKMTDVAKQLDILKNENEDIINKYKELLNEVRENDHKNRKFNDNLKDFINSDDNKSIINNYTELTDQYYSLIKKYSDYKKLNEEVTSYNNNEKSLNEYKIKPIVMRYEILNENYEMITKLYEEDMKEKYETNLQNIYNVKKNIFNKLNKDNNLDFDNFNNYRNKYIENKEEYINIKNELKFFELNNKEKCNSYKNPSNNNNLFKDENERISFKDKYEKLQDEYKNAYHKMKNSNYFKIQESEENKTFITNFENEYMSTNECKLEEKISNINFIKNIKDELNTLEKNEDIINYNKYKKINEELSKKNRYIKEHKNAKELYNNEEFMKCEDSDSKYIGTDEIIKINSKQYKNKYKASNEEVLELVKLIVMQKIYPINVFGKSKGMTTCEDIDKIIESNIKRIENDINENKYSEEDLNNEQILDKLYENIHEESGHFYGVKKFIDLARDIEAMNCNVKHIHKRENEGCSCFPSISKSNDMIGLLEHTLDFFEKKGILFEDMLASNNINLENLDVLWKEIYNVCKKNYDKFNEYESEYLINVFDKAYIRLKDIASNSEYSDNKHIIVNGNQKNINAMKELTKKIRSFHNQHYKEKTYTNKELSAMENIDVKTAAKSVLNFHNLIEMENEFVELINEIDNNEYSKENIKINENNLKDGNIKEKLKYLSEKLQTLNISKEKEYNLKSKMLNLYKKFEKEMNIIDSSVDNEIDNTLDSATIIIIKNSLLNKLENFDTYDVEIDNIYSLSSERKFKAYYNKLSPYEKLSDELAFIILAAGYEDGTLGTELDKNEKLVPIKIKVMINGEEQEISINKLIPCLRNLEGDKLENKFNKLYEMALLQYLEHFDLKYNEETNELYYNELPEETIKKGNIISYIINPYNINENGEIEYFSLEPENMNIQYSENDKLDNNFKEFISSIDEKDVKNIDINNYDEISNYKIEEWKSKLGSDYDEDTNYFYKVLAIQCAKSKKCKEQFENINKDKLAFNIVNYNTKEKGKSINNYSLIIHNDETKQSTNVFTFKIDDNYEYKIDEISLNNEYSYNELSSVNNNKNADKIAINNKEYAMRPGIGLIAECGFEFEDSNGNIVKPDQYAIKNSDEKIINDKIIEQKYGVANNGEYDMNLVRKEALDLDINNLSNSDLDRSSFKEVGKLMINKRNNCNSNEHCELSDNEIDTFNTYSNLLLKNDLHDENNGMVHYSNEKDFNSNYNDIKETVNLQNEIKTIKNHKSGCLSGANSLRKRNNNKCMKCIEMSRNYGVEDNLISSLNILKKYDSKNIKVKEDEKNISNPKELCKNAATLTEVINIFLDSYENIDNMNKEDSEKMVIKLQNFVKGLEFRYKNARYLTHESIRDINKYDINDMMGLCNDLLDIHESKFGKISDSNGKRIGKISESTSDIETESKYMNDELHEVFNNVHDIINESNQDITSINLVDDIDINNKSDRDDRTYEVTYLLGEIENIYISGSKESKEKIKSDLLKIFDRLMELENVIAKASFNNDEFVNNSEVIYKLSDGIVNKLKNNFSEDKEVQEKLKIYKDNINGIRKTNVKSSNILNLDHIISQVDMEDYIFNDSRSKMYVKMFFDKLKNEFYEINEANTNEGTKYVNKKLNEINERINEKIKQFNNYKKFEGNYQEAYHLVELINNYNELVSTVLSDDKDNIEINYIYISNNVDLNNRLNYVRLNEKQKNEDKILKSNPKQFNGEKYKKIEEAIDKNIAKKYTFGVDVVSEGSYTDYRKIMVDRNNIKSNVDILNKFIDSSTNNNQLIGIRQSYNLGYKLMMNELTDYRDEDMVNSVNYLESRKKIFNNIKNNNLKYFETSKQTETRYKNNILTIIDIKNVKTDNIDNIDNIIYIINNKNLVKDMSENEVSEFENQLKNVCMFEKNELIRYSGNTPSKYFEDINNGYDTFSSNIIVLLKKLPNNKNNNNNNEQYQKLNLNKNLIKHNNAYQHKLNNNNPVVKNPPLNKHKNGKITKRSLIKIKYNY